MGSIFSRRQRFFLVSLKEGQRKRDKKGRRRGGKKRKERKREGGNNPILSSKPALTKGLLPYGKK